MLEQDLLEQDLLEQDLLEQDLLQQDLLQHDLLQHDFRIFGRQHPYRVVHLSVSYLNRIMDDLAGHFEKVAVRLDQERTTLNQSDTINGNHGDHMIAIFQVATQAAQQITDDDLPAAMELAGKLLQQMEDNGSAQIYALGLQQFALQFRERGVSYDHLASYIQSALSDDKPSGPKESKSGDVLKALVAGLADWKSSSRSEEGAKKGMDMGYLFDLGVAYMQARQAAAGKIEALAATAVSVSPLGENPYRSRSGKLVIETLLQSLQQG